MQINSAQLQSIAERRLQGIRHRAYMSHHTESGPCELDSASSERMGKEHGEDTGKAPAERRRSARICVNSAVPLRAIGTTVAEVVVLEEISSTGCRVVCQPAKIGDCVIARFPQLEPLGSRICWTEGSKAGVEFRKTIHSAVFNSLIERLSGSTPSRG